MIAARWLSIVFHPFVTVAAMVGAAAAARQSRADAVRKWDNVDASNRTERPILYLVGGVSLLALLGFLTLRGPQSFMLRGVIARFATLAATALTVQRHTGVEVALGTIIGAVAGIALHYL